MDVFIVNLRSEIMQPRRQPGRKLFSFQQVCDMRALVWSRHWMSIWI